MEAQIRCQMRDRGFNNMNAVMDAVKSDAKKHPYHPIKDYLNGLKYDGGAHIETLASYFIDKHGVFNVWLRRWLIGSVAKMISGEQNPMLVLDGQQDMGKDYFARWLIPESLRNKHFVEQPIDTEDKDTYVRLTNVWIWDVAELQATTRKADKEALKHIITQSQVRVRRAYDRYDTMKPTITSFIGTLNNDTGLLTDPTGSRRFLICHLTDIDWNYETKINLDAIWSEAYAAFLAGENWKLSASEAATRNTVNEEYEVTEPVEEMIKKIFEIKPDDQNIWMSTLEILRELETNGLTGNQRMNMLAIGSAMTKLKCQPHRDSNKRGYFGIASKMVKPASGFYIP